MGKQEGQEGQKQQDCLEGQSVQKIQEGQERDFPGGVYGEEEGLGRGIRPSGRRSPRGILTYIHSGY